MTWEDLAEEYLGASPGTNSTRHILWLALSQFLAHLPWEVQQVHQLMPRHLTGYRAWLARQALEPVTIYERYQSIRVFLRWAYRKGVLLSKSGLEEEEKNPPRRLFARYSQAQMLQLLEQPALDSLQGQLDRFVMELFYGTGLRSQEAQQLRLVDLADGGLWVRQGKGGKDRFLPIGPFLASKVQLFLQEIRPRLGPEASQERLLVNLHGNPLHLRAWAQRFRNYARQLGLPARGLHSLRHAYATHLLEGGARLEDLQRLLGHSSMTTTQLYAQVTVHELAREVRRTHPRARCKKPK